jgi:predicted SnoaL-like aldol condensation-catalyzing enzyme
MAQSDRKWLVQEFFRLISQGHPEEGLRFFTPDCKQHNPYVFGGMDALVNAMKAVQSEGIGGESDAGLSVKRMLEDGDFVVAHTELYNSSSDHRKGGLRQVHLFRFGEANKIVEYWDVTQLLTPDMPNVANGF